MQGEEWATLDGKWRNTRKSVMEQMEKMESQLLSTTGAIETVVQELEEAAAELSTHPELPKTLNAVQKTKARLPLMVMGIATLRKSMDSLRRFVVNETTSHHNSMSAGMSAAELELIAEMNPFVPLDDYSSDE